MKTLDTSKFNLLNRPSTKLSEVLLDVDPPGEIFNDTQQASVLPGQVVQQLHVDDIAFGSFQTRQFSNEFDLDGLAASILSQGIVQPLVVRAIQPDDPREESFEVIAGERRLRAARQAGLTHVPVIVRDYSDQDALEVAVIENAQRQDLNPIEEAHAFKRLADEFHMSHKEIAEAVGKNRATIANSIRLLNLDPTVIEYLVTGQLSAGHGRALLTVEEPRVQRRLAIRAVENALSVHALERLIQRLSEAESLEEESPEQEDKLRLEKQSAKIADVLGLERVDLKVDSQGRRRLNVVFETEASWKRFVSRMKA